ncbi:hypothetical protein T484DRAFT_1764496 [Baffinella frigidus]|nr:hypothetical protein T484DRAFT_1764496 [Cryptophyta sp. CCMP2293]
MAPVRVSKFRHVHGTSAPKERSCDGRCYENTGNAPAASPDSNGIDGNTQYFAIPWQGGGGPFTIIPLGATGRQAPVPKVFQGHSGPIQDLGFSPFQNTVVASSSEDSTVRVWNFSDAVFDENSEILPQKTRHIEDSTVRVWNFSDAVSDVGGPLTRDVGVESSVELKGHSKKATLLR